MKMIEMGVLKLHKIQYMYFNLILTIVYLFYFQTFNCIQLVSQSYPLANFNSSTNNYVELSWKPNETKLIAYLQNNESQIATDNIDGEILKHSTETFIRAQKKSKAFQSFHLNSSKSNSFNFHLEEFLNHGENENMQLLRKNLKIVIDRVKKSPIHFKDKEKASSIEIPKMNRYLLNSTALSPIVLKKRETIENETSSSNSYKVKDKAMYPLGLSKENAQLQNPHLDSRDLAKLKSEYSVNELGHEEKDLDNASNTTSTSASMDFNRSTTKEVETFVHKHKEAQREGQQGQALAISTETFLQNSTYSSVLVDLVTASSISLNSKHDKDISQNYEEEKQLYSHVDFNMNSTLRNDNNITEGSLNIMTNEEFSTQRNERTLTLVELFYAKYPVKVWKAVGLFDDSYIEDGGIDPHWMGFDAPDPIVHKLLAISYGVIMVVGCGGNFLVVYMFVRCKSLRTPANYLICNLAVSDFFMLAKMPIFIFNSLYLGPALGSIGCKLYGFFGGLTGTASIMTLAAIAVDRYFAIAHPLNPFKRTTFQRATLMIVAVWIYSCVFSTMPLLGLNAYVSEGYLTSCSFDYLSTKVTSRIFVFIFFLAAWLFPLCIIIFSYVEIYRTVRKAENIDLGGKGESFKYKKSRAKQNTDIKIAILSTIVIGAWICSWTPYAVVALLGIFGQSKYITPFVSAIPALFCKTASCIDPFFYAIKHPRFQRELKTKFNTLFSSIKRSSKSKAGSRNNSFASATCQLSLNNQDHESSGSIKCNPGCINIKNQLGHMDTTSDPQTTNKQSNKISLLLKAMEKNSGEKRKLDEIEMGSFHSESLDESTSKVAEPHAFVVDETAEDLRNTSCGNDMTEKVREKGTKIFQSKSNRPSIISESFNFHTEVIL